MYIWREKAPIAEEIRIYPFLDADADPKTLGLHGHITAFVNPRLLDLFGLVRFNLSVDHLTQESWQKIDAAVSVAFREIDKARETIVPDKSIYWWIEKWTAETVSVKLASGRQLTCKAEPEFLVQLCDEQKRWGQNADIERNPTRVRPIETLPLFIQLIMKAEQQTATEQLTESCPIIPPAPLE